MAGGLRARSGSERSRRRLRSMRLPLGRLSDYQSKQSSLFAARVIVCWSSATTPVRERQQLLAVCALIQKDVDALITTAKEDLRLHFVRARLPWWKRLVIGRKRSLKPASHQAALPGAGRGEAA